MKKIILTAFAIAACFFANAQQAKIDYAHCVIANEEMNVVYRGYKNIINVAVAGIADADLIVSSTGATITREGEHWICEVTTDKSELVINVSANIDGKTQLVGTKCFRVRGLPLPSACIKLANGETWTADKGGIKKTKFEGASLVTTWDAENISDKLTVTSFNLAVSDGQGGFFLIPSDGNKFSAAQIEAINKMSSGTMITLSNIEYTGAKTGKNLPFTPLVLK